jgi:RNA polymerase sigma-70 factor (ECF subfamily)
MLRIMEGEPGSGSLRVEGRLSGPWVGELRRSCATILSGGRAPILDLSNLVFVDRAGAGLLRDLRQRGAQLVNASRFVVELLKEETVPPRRRGNAVAVERLVARFADSAYRIALGVTGSARDAEDVVREVFTTALPRLQAVDGGQSARAWICGLAIRAARRRRRSRPPAGDDGLPRFKPDGHRDGERAFLLADWSAAADDAPRSAERRAAMASGIEGLPDDEREAVFLVDVEGLSGEDAAGALGESPAAVRARLHRARMALREQVTRAHVARA